jgi:hypothetical protein
LPDISVRYNLPGSLIPDDGTSLDAAYPDGGRRL